jgi:tRNA-specific 2-thiouridylase
MMENILVAMSGGVDSAVAALLLKQRFGSTAEIAGATFRLWKIGGADNSGDIRDAKAVCAQLGLKHYVMEFSDIFQKEVVAPFAGAYEAGETPNPCVVCNEKIKFGAFLQAARELGYTKIATGHYARIRQENSQYRLCRAAYPEKDQSYFLYRLKQEQLAAAELPLGEYSKEEVRSLALAEGLAVSRKSDSQDICFLPKGDYGSFLERYLEYPAVPGDFLNESGEIIGKHRGIRFYTIGPRKGLGATFGKPVFVKAIDAARNTITLSDNGALFSSRLAARGLNWIGFDTLKEEIPAQAKIRNAHRPAAAVISPDGEQVLVRFAEPQRAVTPGQSAVFYDGEYVLGGGRIISESVNQ